MDGGTDTDVQPLPITIHMKVNIDSINDMDVESIVGQMVGSMMETLLKISDTERDLLSGRMERNMSVILIRDSEKDMGGIHFRMEDIMLEVGWMDVMKGLEVCIVIAVFEFEVALVLQFSCLRVVMLLACFECIHQR